MRDAYGVEKELGITKSSSDNSTAAYLLAGFPKIRLCDIFSQRLARDLAAFAIRILAESSPSSLAGRVVRSRMPSAGGAVSHLETHGRSGSQL